MQKIIRYCYLCKLSLFDLDIIYLIRRNIGNIVLCKHFIHRFISEVRVENIHAPLLV